jgi:large subunit ribosomal protein L14e
MKEGQMCVKLAGRDAGKKCVIVEVLDKNFVTIDGNVRRRKCNKIHLIPLKETIDIKKKASHSDVIGAFKKLKLDVWETKPKKATERPKKIRKGKTAEEKAAQKKVKKEKYAKEMPEKESKLEAAVKAEESKADAKETVKTETKAKVEAKTEVKDAKVDAKEKVEKVAALKDEKK